MTEVSISKGRLPAKEGFSLLRPTWEAYNSYSETLCDQLINELGLPSTVGKLPRYRTFLASLLVLVQSRAFNRNTTPIGVPGKKDYWSSYPLVGRQVAQNCMDALQPMYLTKVEGSGKRHFYKNESNKIVYDSITSLYHPTQMLLSLENLKKAEFIETGRIPVKINVAETHSEKHQRQQYTRSKPSLNLRHASGDSKSAIESDRQRMSTLVKFWRVHPLGLSLTRYAASATRIYHNGRTDSGGRLYGAWTNAKSDTRKTYTIDGEPTAQIDVTASQPTLLSALLGVPFRITDTNQVSSMWYDPYGEIAFSYLGVLDDDKIWENWGTPANTSMVTYRNLFKKVSAELIGTGNPAKKTPSADTRRDFDLTNDQWIKARDFLLERIPALHRLDKTYINGSNFLSYHESEVMLKALEMCLEQKLPAYPVHDCLIVKETDVDKAAELFKEAAREHLIDMGREPIDLGVSIETEGGKRKYKGKYL